eukprot:231603_1
MRELHGKYIVHRDLKPGNVLIHCDDEKAQKYTSKLCDFGGSKKLNPDNFPHRNRIQSLEVASGLYASMDAQNVMGSYRNIEDDYIEYSVVGTEEYFAPELPQANSIYRTEDHKKLFALDVYAFGIMMWEVGFCKKIEAKNRDTPHVFAYDEMKDKFNNRRVIYEKYIDLMKWCWTEQPENRPQFDEIFDKLQEVENSV